MEERRYQLLVTLWTPELNDYTTLKTFLHQRRNSHAKTSSTSSLPIVGVSDTPEGPFRPSFQRLAEIDSNIHLFIS